MKEAANQIGFGGTVAVEVLGSDAHRAASEVYNQPALEPSKTPALTLGFARGASPTMRERRVNVVYYALMYAK
jgi:hypothetical protein